MPPSSPPSPLSGSRRQWPFYYGWVVVGVACITMGIGVNTRTAFSLLFPPILQEFGWERGVTAGAFSVGFLASTLYAPFIGMLMDRVGPRLVLPIGVVMMSLGMVLATLISQPWHLYLTLGVLVVGGSVFVSYIGHSLFLPHWFVRKRGLAIGLAFSGVGIGSIILFPWLQRLIGQTGWRQACLSLAVLLFATLLPLNLIFPQRRPEDMGLRPDGDPPQEHLEGGNTVLANVVDHAWASTEWTLGKAVKTARFWWMFIGFFGGLFTWYAVQVHQTKYLLDIAFPAEQAAYALGLVGLTGIIGQIALGHLSDRVGREWAWTLSGCGFMLCYAVLLLLPAFPGSLLLYLMVAAQGVLGYGLASVFGAITAEVFHGKHYGTIFGTLNLASSSGAACGPWITGLVHDLTGSYAPAFVLAIVLSLVSIGAIWLAAPRKVRVVAGQIARLQAQRASQHTS